METSSCTYSLYSSLKFGIFCHFVFSFSVSCPASECQAIDVSQPFISLIQIICFECGTLLIYQVLTPAQEVRNKGSTATVLAMIISFGMRTHLSEKLLGNIKENVSVRLPGHLWTYVQTLRIVSEVAVQSQNCQSAVIAPHYYCSFGFWPDFTCEHTRQVCNRLVWDRLPSTCWSSMRSETSTFSFPCFI